MKPAIYWTLIGTPWSDYRIMAVTSEKPGRMVYGRDAQGCSTHRTMRDVNGRFPTEEAAKAVIEQMRAIDREFAQPLNDIEAQRRSIETLRNNAKKAILKMAGAA